MMIMDAKNSIEAVFCPYPDCPDRYKAHGHIDERPQPKHEHQHTIPVEWEYTPEQVTRFVSNDDYATKHDEVTRFATKRVTKLRCPCGDTVDI